MDFQVAVIGNGDAAALCCRGRLVLEHGTSVLHEAVQLSAGKSLVLDLEDVTQVDASGIGVLAEMIRATRATGGVIALAAASDRVTRALRLAGLDTFLRAQRDAVGGLQLDQMVSGIL